MKYDVKTIKEYLDVLPTERKILMMKLISLLHEYFPELEGDMKYNMPTFDPVCAMASQKNFVSLYVYKTDLVEKYKDELKNLKVGKSCIRFKKMDEMPEKNLRKIFSEVKKRNSKSAQKNS